MPPDLVAVPLEAWIDPERLFVAHESVLPHAFWLDAGPGATTGWSYLGGGSPEDDPAAPHGVRCDHTAGEVFATEPWPAGPFRGGWVGWIGYEVGVAHAGAPTAVPAKDDPDEGDPDRNGERWLRVDHYLAFDHAAHRVWAVAPAPDAAAWARTASERLASAPPVPTWPAPSPSTATSRDTPDAYAALIGWCRDAIREGDAYQLCLTTRFTVSDPVDPAATYGRLRAATPAHHGGYIRVGELALLSASPEQFLAVEGGTVRTRPIKGTRPRGTDAASDATLAAELRASPKEQAENVMIVDLMRNDLSRVSEPGTVRVNGLLEVESYAAVHQLVSTVSGRLRAGTTIGGLLDATFPAGSMTGAPKLSAMTILHGLERAPRGVYSGCFGYIGRDGSADLAMTIRTVITHPAGAYVGAGGGITWGSDAEAEVAEVGIKARAPLAALGAELPAGW